MENNDRYLEACGAGERAGLYYTCVNSYLTAPELAYILNNSTSKLLITSRACREVALEAARDCPGLTSGLIVGGTGDDGIFADFEEATRGFPGTPIGDESLGTAMLYSSGTTGRPKGIVRPLDDIPPGDQLPVFSFLSRLWQYRDGLTYLSPAPLYHSAPQAAVNLAIRHGGTVIIMEKFDPGQYLRLVEQYRVTHSQLVPTMFSRMLKLPEPVRSRYDLSSLEVAVHAAAPCPVPVKQQMIDWWGPVLLEYYIYPQECENLLITHPKVADAAVFGVPNEDLGEEVKAVVQLMPGTDPGPEVAAELIAFCREHLAHLKCPRTIDFADQLPRLPTGKLYKKPLRDSYWGQSRSRIV